MISKEKIKEIVKNSTEEVWYNRRSFNPVTEQTNLITEKVFEELNKKIEKLNK